jgi:hypothetical protein
VPALFVTPREEDNDLACIMTTETPKKKRVKLIKNSSDELREYLLCEDGAPQFYWPSQKTQLPVLYDLALRHNCLLNSTASVERLFSVCKFLSEARRNRLTIENMNNRLVISQNRR